MQEQSQQVKPAVSERLYQPYIAPPEPSKFKTLVHFILIALFVAAILLAIKTGLMVWGI